MGRIDPTSRERRWCSSQILGVNSLIHTIHTSYYYYDSHILFILLEYKRVILYNTFNEAPRNQCWEEPMEMIKVSANSRTSAVAGAIAGVVREHKRAEVQAIGAGAVNQAVKALVLATGYLKNDGLDIVCVPEFADVTIDDKVRTAIKLVVEPR